MGLVVRGIPWLLLSGALGLSGCPGSQFAAPVEPNDSAHPSSDLALGDEAMVDGVDVADNGSPAALAPSLSMQARGNVERHPGLGNPVVMELLAHDLSIEGEWECFDAFWGSRSLTVKRDANSPQRYRLHYVDALDLGDFEFERTATLSDGVLTLNRPIREFGTRNYCKVLFVLQIEDIAFLVPSERAEALKSRDDLRPVVAYLRRTSADSTGSAWARWNARRTTQ